MCVCLQEALQQLRALDDKIIYKLNTSVPTQSFAGLVSADERCKQLYEEVGRPIRGLRSFSQGVFTDEGRVPGSTSRHSTLH